MRTIKLTKVISGAGYAISVILLAAFSTGSTALPAPNHGIRANMPALTVPGSYVESVSFQPRLNILNASSTAIWQDKASGTYWSVFSSRHVNVKEPVVYIYSMAPDAAGWKQEAELAASDWRDGDVFGESVAIEDQTIAIGSASLAGNGKVYVFVKDSMSGGWLLQKELSTDDTGAYAFGRAVSLSGDSLAVGEPGGGHVYVYERAGGDWSLSQRVDPPKSATPGEFGTSLQLSGNSIIIGAPFESTPGEAAGAAYIYTRNPSFSDPVTLRAPSPIAHDVFGWSVAINSSIAVVGAPTEGDGGTGRADTFAYDSASATWNFVKSIAPSDSNPDGFGHSLCLDGDTLAVGAPNILPTTADDYGKVFVYVAPKGPGQWEAQASFNDTMVPVSDMGYSTSLAGNVVLSGGAATSGINTFYRQAESWYEKAPIFGASDNGENFGKAVSISNNVAVVTAPLEPSTEIGIVATIYTKDSTGQWNWTQELSDVEVGYDAIGFHSCSPVVADGNRIFIGIPDENSGQGAVHVYAKGADSWTEETTLLAADGAAGDLFGCSISTSADRVLIGAPGRNHYQGAGYMFTVASGGWNEESILTSTDGAANDYLGNSAFLSGDTAVLGAPFRNGSTGTAFVFARSAGTWTQSANLSAKDVATGDEFGATVAIAGDSVIVGSPNKTVSMNAGAGGAYVFRQSGSSWVEQETFEGDSANAYLGSSISASTSRMIIGVPGANAVQIYDDTSGSWELYSTAGGSYSTSSFGSAVGISGTTIIVGAPTTGAHEGGEAFIFTDTDVILADSFE